MSKSESDSIRMRKIGEVRRPGTVNDKNEDKIIYPDDP
jgi:hypothetical protein